MDGLKDIKNANNNPDLSFCDSTMVCEETPSILSSNSLQVYGTSESPPHEDVCKILLSVDTLLHAALDACLVPSDT